MTAVPVLVDSCWYIRLLLAQRDPFRELRTVAYGRDLATCGVIRCEVARGISDPQRLKKFDARWDAMIDVPTDHSLWSDVEALLWKLDRQGIVLPLPDVVIACCARRIGAVVLTHDAHFRVIPGIRTTDYVV